MTKYEAAQALALLMALMLAGCSTTPRISESDRNALNAMSVAVHQNIQQ